MTHRRLSFRDRAELRLAHVLLPWMSRFGSAAEVCVPPGARTYIFGDNPPDNAQQAQSHAAIPGVVWTYWSGPAMPALIARCIANWRRLNPHMQIHVLDEQTARHWVGDFPASLVGASATLHADWLRLALLHRYGGIWLDASTILTQPLDWVLEPSLTSRSDLVAYFLGRYTHDSRTPVIENWFLAAPAESPFIADVFREFTEQVLPRGGVTYARMLSQETGYAQLLQGIDMPEYLSMHLAMQRLLRSGKTYRLTLRRAEDGPFFYHALGNWGRTALKLRLLMRRAANTPPPLIKLRKPDRKRLDLYLERGLVSPHSVVGQYLCLSPAPLSSAQP